jgi:hypothetical protein
MLLNKMFIWNYEKLGNTDFIHQITPERQKYPDVAFIEGKKEYLSTAD